MQIFGVDIGGSGIKGAPVDLERGDLAQERHKVLTPHPATPDGGGRRRRRGGRATSAGPARSASPSRAWSRAAPPVRRPTSTRAGSAPTRAPLLGDAARRPAGHGPERRGRGGRRGDDVRGRARAAAARSSCSPSARASAAPLFIGRRASSRTRELGHLELHGHDAETRASTKAKEDEELTWEHWATRGSRSTSPTWRCCSRPELFIIGGGVSRKPTKFLPLIEGIRAEIVPAELQNNAGIVGAAMAARAAKG